ncbi:MAG: 4Fe-4S binding protein, partial [Bacteroidales bacterium]|nr:4Fe-4S binding protein [Candidatus Colimorpha onthohippi]
MEAIKKQIHVCCGAGCKASGGNQIVEQFKEVLAAKNLQDDVQVVEASCFGMCAKGPIVKVDPDNVIYVGVKPDDVSRIVESHILLGNVVEELQYKVDPLQDYAMLLIKGAMLLKKPGVKPDPAMRSVVLTGAVQMPGLYDVPKETTLRALIDTYGGGLLDGRSFKAVVSSGMLGGCMGAQMLDTQLDDPKGAGGLLGTMGLVVMDSAMCAVDLLRKFLSYASAETCGKCTPCRVGNLRMLEIVERIAAGEGSQYDLEQLRTLATVARDASLCGFGQTSGVVVLGLLDMCAAEIAAHVTDRRCPAGVCKQLITYRIDKEKCIGCGKCAKNCPAEAISRTEYIAPGHKLESMQIDVEKRLKCGT